MGPVFSYQKVTSVTAHSTKCIAILPAAGNGTRMGGERAKVLRAVAGVSVLERTIRAFEESRAVDEIVIAAREHECDEIRSACTVRRGTIPISVVVGGRVRQESVYLALESVRARNASPHSLIAIHDAARCLITSQIIRNAVSAALECGAVTVAVPLVDSIKKVSPDGAVIESLSRENVWSVQTPQVFRLDLILDAHSRSPVHEGSDGATDDASLVERLHPVKVVQGSRVNLKITTPEDLVMAEAILATR